MNYRRRLSCRDKEVTRVLKALDLTALYIFLCIKVALVRDPCMGSGHILVYLFDILVQIYEAYGYPTREAVASIVQNSLWGLDIDDRAAQLANFAVMMMARRYDKGWFRRGIQPHVMAIQESNGINRGHLRYLGNSLSDLECNNAITQMESLLDVFIDAKEFGSILQLEQYDWEALRRFVHMTDTDGQVTLGEVGIESTQERLLQIIEQGQALAQKYHVVVTNPPYMGNGGMGDKLIKHVKNNYPDTKSDMSTVMMERCLLMCKDDGLMSMINIPVWMFLSSYEKLRYSILKNNTYVNMIHPGRGIFGSDFGTTTFVIAKKSIPGYIGSYRRLFDKQGEVDSIEEREQAFLSGKGKYAINQDSFSRIPGAPVAYWVSSHFIDVFSAPRIETYAKKICKGGFTGNNDRYLRLWYEISYLSIPTIWNKYSKGGPFRRWFGNSEYVVFWKDNGHELKTLPSAGMGASKYRTLKRKEGEGMRPALETKEILNPGEAIQLYGMSARRFQRLLQSKRKLPFLALYHKRKLIIRAEFDKYLEEHPEEKEHLKKCQRTNKEDVMPSDEFCAAARVSGLTENTSSSTW